MWGGNCKHFGLILSGHSVYSLSSGNKWTKWIKLVSYFPFIMSMKWPYYTKFIKLHLCQNLSKLSEVWQSYSKIIWCSSPHGTCTNCREKRLSVLQDSSSCNYVQPRSEGVEVAGMQRTQVCRNFETLSSTPIIPVDSHRKKGNP